MRSSLPDLESALENLGLDCETSKKDLLYEYIELLFKWHEKSNILSTRDKKYFIQRDMFDSLSILKHLPAGNLLDIGTGGGIPGMLLSFFISNDAILIDRRLNAIRFLEYWTLRLLNAGIMRLVEFWVIEFVGSCIILEATDLVQVAYVRKPCKS